MVFSTMDLVTNVKYYNNLKKLDGVYTKYIFFNLFYVLIACVYMFIKGADMVSKIMILFQLGSQIWKLRKIYNITFQMHFPFITLTYKIEYAVEKSKDYETEAVNLMVKFLLIPVGVCYLIYRMYYYYSSNTNLFDFIIEYIFFMFGVFGFILMTPQIYLNYKLQSVEHFPFKVMIFKFLDTIVDDLEIFALKTPTLYRVFCFKDDVIFVIYLFQLWKYRNNKIVDQFKKNKELEDKDKDNDKKNK